MLMNDVLLAAIPLLLLETHNNFVRFHAVRLACLLGWISQLAWIELIRSTGPATVSGAVPEHHSRLPPPLLALEPLLDQDHGCCRYWCGLVSSVSPVYLLLFALSPSHADSMLLGCSTDAIPILTQTLFDGASCRTLAKSPIHGWKRSDAAVQHLETLSLSPCGFPLWQTVDSDYAESQLRA